MNLDRPAGLPAATLATTTSGEVPARVTVLVPIGSVEQHGPHLPLHTDTVIADAVANRAAETLAACGTPVLVAPALSYGSSGEHQHFPGTSSIGTAALHMVLVELVRSMHTWAHRVIFINAHGGNTTALCDAVSQLTGEGHHVTWVACTCPGADLHAGRAETSLMLHLQPDTVRVARARAGNTATLEQLLPSMQAHGVTAVSPNGVLGDPTGATPQEGTRLLHQMVRDAVAACR